MIIKLHKDFKKSFKKLSLKIQEKAKERLMLFEKDPLNPVLNNHPLRGKYLNHRSVNITGDLRAIYKKVDDEITFIKIDSHSNLYG